MSMSTRSAHNGRERVRVGLVGLGGFGSLHAAILGRLADADLVAVCDRDPDRLDATADRYEVPTRCSDLDALLETDVEAVVLAVPEGLHVSMALQVIQSGRHCLVEKPLATTAADGRTLVMAAEVAGVRLQVGHVLRFDAQHAMLREAVRAGELGQLLSLRAKRNLSRSWVAGGLARIYIALENLVHDVDQIVWLLADRRCTKAYAVEHRTAEDESDFVDACVAMLQFDDGAVAVVETSWTVPGGAPLNVVADGWTGHIDSTLEVVGTQGTGRVNGFDSGLRLWTSGETITPAATLWPYVHGRVTGALHDEDAHFLQTIRTGEASTIASLDDAVHGLEILEAIEQSAALGREVEIAPAQSDVVAR